MSEVVFLCTIIGGSDGGTEFTFVDVVVDAVNDEYVGEGILIEYS